MSVLPQVGASVPRRGSPATQAFGRAVLRLMGWRVTGEIPDLPKFVVAVAPHTSNWDFVVGAAAMFALDLELTFIGKDTLFGWPLGGVLRWMGGVPVDRSAPHGVVGETIAAINGAEKRVIAIAPQGTRKPVPRFKSGFLHIARGAGVPVLCASLDYAARCVRFGPMFTPGADVDADLARVEALFATVKGKNS